MNIAGPLTVAELNATLFGTSDARAVPTDTIIKTMLDVGSGISDLIFSPGRPPQVERYGELVEVQDRRVADAAPGRHRRALPTT